MKSSNFYSILQHLTPIDSYAAPKQNSFQARGDFLTRHLEKNELTWVTFMYIIEDTNGGIK